ncbi:hypothetical protein [Saccharibacillus qingshengii]|uniref:hypothetical protein n=1 Tax=Saccharibacillus qingshengii TaxID=1763540 RepID=UPI001556A4EC|nr:hypothetical protein [Saccharibacillus qingshengii]
MLFCTNCGNPIKEGETHVCPAAPASSTGLPSSSSPSPAPNPIPSSEPIPAHTPPSSAGSTAKDYGTLVKGELSKFEKGTLLGLLKNPMSALQLRGETDLRYGLMGLAASLIGYMLWAWSFKRNLLHTLFEMSGGGSSSEWRDGYSEISKQFAILSPLFVIGLVSLIALIVGALGLGSWLGTNKISGKEALAKLGSVQLAIGAGFLACALMMFVSLRLGLLLLIVALLSAWALTLLASVQLFRVSSERMLPMVALFALVMVAAIAITFNLQVQAGIENLLGSTLGDFL